MSEIGAADPHAVVVYVAAILFESGAHREVQKTICRHRHPRTTDRPRRGPRPERSRRRRKLARQPLPEEKIKRADYRIDNSGTKDDTLRQIRLIWEDLKEARIET